MQVSLEQDVAALRMLRDAKAVRSRRSLGMTRTRASGNISTETSSLWRTAG